MIHRRYPHAAFGAPIPPALARFGDQSLGSDALVVAIDSRAAARLEALLSLLYLGVAVRMIGLSTAGAYLCARRIVRPVRRLASAAEAAAQGRLDASLPRELPARSRSWRPASATC